MYKKCTTEKTIQRQIEFENTFLSMLEQIAYKEITITAICKKMQIQRKAFYRYFDSIDDIVDSIADRLLEETYIYLEGDINLEGYFETFKRKKSTLDVLAKHNLIGVLMERTWVQTLDKRKNEEFYLKDIAHITGAYGFLAMVVAWHHNGMKQDIKELIHLSEQTYQLHRQKQPN